MTVFGNLVLEQEKHDFKSHIYCKFTTVYYYNQSFQHSEDITKYYLWKSSIISTFLKWIQNKNNVKFWNVKIIAGICLYFLSNFWEEFTFCCNVMFSLPSVLLQQFFPTFKKFVNTLDWGQIKCDSKKSNDDERKKTPGRCGCFSGEQVWKFRGQIKKEKHQDNEGSRDTRLLCIPCFGTAEGSIGLERRAAAWQCTSTGGSTTDHHCPSALPVRMCKYPAACLGKTTDHCECLFPFSRTIPHDYYTTRTMLFYSIYSTVQQF